MKTISICIPVFNEENNIENTYNEIISLFEKKLINYDYEIIFTDDGSQDNSLQVLLELREKDNKVKVIEFSRNFGQIEAISAAQRKAIGDAVITVSADLQEPLGLISQMVNRWEEGNEIVIGFRLLPNVVIEPKNSPESGALLRFLIFILAFIFFKIFINCILVSLQMTL